MRDICKACNRGFNPQNSPYDGYGPSCGKKHGVPVIPGRENLLTKPVVDEHDQYEYARESKFQNVGEDIKNSARHKFHEYRTLAEAEAEGAGAKFAVKSALMKDMDFLEGLNATNDLTKLTGYLVLSKFPDKPEITSGYNDADDNAKIEMPYIYKSENRLFSTTAGEARKKAREAYVNLFNELKDIALKGTSPDEIISKSRKAISAKVDSLRDGDPFNVFSDQLAKFYNQKLLGYKKNGVLDIKYDMEKKTGEERLQAIKELIGSGKKTTKKAKDKKERPEIKTAYAEDIERIGKDVPYKTYEQQANFLTKEVGFRGIQWGQYISDKERQEHMKHLTEAVVDLSEVLNIPASKLSFEGHLGVAIGARGKGKALAHYEPKLKVINIAKQGSGSLAHEYLHAIDNLVAKKISMEPMTRTRANYEGQNLTSASYVKNADQELRGKVDNFNEALRPFVDRMLKNENLHRQTKSKFDYYVNNKQELFARVGERIIQRKLERQNLKNNYLSSSMGDSLYPTDEELKAIEPAFDSLMDYVRKHI